MNIALAQIEKCLIEKNSFSDCSNCDLGSEYPNGTEVVGGQMVKYIHVTKLVLINPGWIFQISRHPNLGEETSNKEFINQSQP